MKNMSSAPPEPYGHGSPEMLREAIAKTLWAVGIHAKHGYELALIGSDGMLQLSVHHAMCNLKAAYETLQDLKELTGREDRNDGSR